MILNKIILTIILLGWAFVIKDLWAEKSDKIEKLSITILMIIACGLIIFKNVNLLNYKYGAKQREQ